MGENHDITLDVSRRIYEAARKLFTPQTFVFGHFVQT